MKDPMLTYVKVKQWSLDDPAAIRKTPTELYLKQIIKALDLMMKMKSIWDGILMVSFF